VEVVRENNLLHRRFDNIDFAQKGNTIRMDDAVRSDGGRMGAVLKNLKNKEGKNGGMSRRSLVEDGHGEGDLGFLEKGRLWERVS